MITLTKEEIKEAIVAYAAEKYSIDGLGLLEAKLCIDINHPVEAKVTIKKVSAQVVFT